jgi:hypothetical protein
VDTLLFFVELAHRPAPTVARHERTRHADMT